MARYRVLNSVAAPFYSVFATTVMSSNSTTVVVTNTDGTLTSITGVGLALTNGVATGGTITSISRLNAAGNTVLETFGETTVETNSFVSFWNAASNAARFTYLFAYKDILEGSTGNDLLEGGSSGLGTNLFYGSPGRDTMRGGIGEDVFFLLGNDLDRDDIDGGTGVLDTLNGESFGSFLWVNLDYNGDEVWTQRNGSWVSLANVVNVESVRGSGYDDQLFGNSVRNAFYGGNGNDTMYGRGGNDSLHGGSGSDKLYGEDGGDYLDGGAGNDTLDGGAGDDYFEFAGDALGGLDLVTGGSGIDEILCFYFDDIAWVDFGHAGAEVFTMVGGAWQAVADVTGVENVSGSLFNDHFAGDVNANRLSGYSGDDYLEGRGGNDTLLGELGNDILIAGDGVDTMEGGEDNDSFRFSSISTGIDSADGGTEEDTVDCSLFNTMAWVDLAYSGAELFTKDASGWKAISNLTNIENIKGSSVADELFGDAANNKIEGRAGNDSLTGRGGADTFQFLSTKFGQDLIKDFVDGTDRLMIDNAIADDISDFTIAGNGTTSVVLTLTNDPAQKITLNGTVAITIGNGDVDWVI